MKLPIAVLVLSDFAIIALIVFLFVSAAFADLRRRLSARRIERKLDALLHHHAIEPFPNLSAEVQRLARDPKQKIAAVRLHREQKGLSLAQAKAEVDELAG